VQFTEIKLIKFVNIKKFAIKYINDYNYRRRIKMTIIEISTLILLFIGIFLAIGKYDYKNQSLIEK
jgi:hypothetical protein